MSDDTLFGGPDFLDVLQHVKEVRQAIDEEYEKSNIIRVDFDKRKKTDQEPG